MSVFPVPKTESGFYQTGTAGSAESFSHIFDPSFNAYRVVGEIVGKAFSDGLKLK